MPKKIGEIRIAQKCASLSRSGCVCVRVWGIGSFQISYFRKRILQCCYLRGKTGKKIEQQEQGFLMDFGSEIFCSFHFFIFVPRLLLCGDSQFEFASSIFCFSSRKKNVPYFLTDKQGMLSVSYS